MLTDYLNQLNAIHLKQCYCYNFTN